MELLTPLLRSSAVTPCFSDTATLQGMLDFEAALANAQAELGIIPAEAARHISQACHSHLFDAADLAQAAAQAGNLAIPLVKQLTTRVAEQNAEAARYVHWGATSQDAIDTGLILQLRQAIELTHSDLNRLIAALVSQITRHQDCVLVGRTWMQHALPTTLGLKLAGTLDALLRYQQRLDEMRPRVLALQLGGAAGTLASLGEQGETLVTALAARLQLTVADTPLAQSTRPPAGDRRLVCRIKRLAGQTGPRYLVADANRSGRGGRTGGRWARWLFDHAAQT
ncbi:3-carboxy-cis,cis-muconate cycloisomerase [Serratia quinivorans]|nr:3-carboxy-cis,cis-muconate cycloisomerase [Serratia quinivorans]